MPHCIIRPCIVLPVKRHELIDRLVEESGGALPVAKAMGVETFQGTLYRIAKGTTTEPSRESAQRIAKHFNIPIEAMYDDAVAERVYRQKYEEGKVNPAIPSNEPPRFDVDQPASYRSADHRLLTRGVVMDLFERGALPERFYFELEDNAMGPKWPKGTSIVFKRISDISEAELGDGIMVKTDEGELLVRYLAEGAAQGEWRAIGADRDIHRDRHSSGLVVVALWLTPAESRLSRG